MNVTFHGVGESPRAPERGEEGGWLDLDSFESILDSVVDRPNLRITFEDGNLSDVVHALPALRRRDLEATFFVVAGQLGAPGFLDDLGVRTLLESGMSIGCHGLHHRPWRRLNDEALRDELVVARQILEAIVEQPVTEAACPFGSYDRRVLRSLRRYGYKHVYTSDRGLTYPEAWLQPRTSLGTGAGAQTIEQALSSERRPFRVLLRQPRLVTKRWR